MSSVFGYGKEIMNIISNDFTTDKGSKTKENLMQEYGEPLFEIIAETEFNGDMVELSDAQKEKITNLVDSAFDFAAEVLEQKFEQKIEEWMNDGNFMAFGFGRKNKSSRINDAKNNGLFDYKQLASINDDKTPVSGRKNKSSFINNTQNLSSILQNGAERLNNLWQNSKSQRTNVKTNTKRGGTRRTTTNNTDDTTQKTTINNDGLQKILNLKNKAAIQNTNTVTVNQQEDLTAQEQVAKDPLEGKTPAEKKTILEQTVQSQRENITKIANGTSEAVQSAVANMQKAEEAMNTAIDNDNSINDEVKAQVKESETAITAKSGEVSAKEAEIAQTDASITQTQGTISNLQNALDSLAQPTGKEGDEEKDAKLNARRAELQSQIAAKQAELAQLQAQKQEQEAQKAQLETEKGQLETNKDAILAEELKDSPYTRAAIEAFENARTNVETTKSNEIQKAQNELNDTITKLNEVEAEIEQQKNASANTNFDINGMIEAFAQGQIGDCWLLSSLQALSNSEEGRKMLQDAVKVNEDGTYTVKFDGVDWEQTFTDADLRTARNSGVYSSGDDDALLMEVAVQRFLEQARNGQVKLSDTTSQVIDSTVSIGDNPLDGGTSVAVLAHLLTGSTNSDSAYNSVEANELLNKLQNNDNAVATLSFRPDDNGILNTLNAGSVTTGANADSGHLWSVKSVNGDKVTLINPWNSSQEIVTTRSELANHKIELTYQDLAA